MYTSTTQFQRRSVNFSNDGFIVIFLAVIIVGVACLFQSRGRGFRRLRRISSWQSEDGNPEHQPKLWEPWVANAIGLKWDTLMPLSASVLRCASIPSTSPASPPAQTAQDVPQRLPLWPLRLSHKVGVVPDRPATRKSQAEVQVTVVIAMPCPDHNVGGRELKLGEYNIGVANITYVTNS